MLDAFQALNPWPVTMLPEAFRQYQALDQLDRDQVARLAAALKSFPPAKRYFQVRHDLNAPVLRVRALAEPHLRVKLNAEYHMLRGECIVVYLAGRLEKESHEKGKTKRDRPRD